MTPISYRYITEPKHHACTIISVGVWGVGVATPMVRVDAVPLGTDTHSWVLTSEGTTVHNGEVISRINSKPVEGDVLVRTEDIHTICCYNHIV